MLKFFSRLEKTRNLVIIVFALILIVGMVFLIPSQTGRTGNLLMSDETAASVGSDSITVGQIATEQETSQRMFQGRMPVQTQQILDRLIGTKLSAQEAQRLGFYATDQEVRDKIYELFTPQDGKSFDVKKYEQRVTESYGSVGKFEKQMREQIAIDKFRAFVVSGVSVSEEEVLADYKKQNTKFNLTYVPVSAMTLAETIKPTDDELKTYFDANKQNFYINQTQKKLKYIFVSQTKAGEKLQLTEEDMKAEFDQMPAERKRAGVNVQQIVLKVAKPEMDAEIEQKATALVQQARAKGNGTVSEEDFAQLAQGNSQDPATANNGGRLPGLVTDTKNPSDPVQQTLTMTVGAITEPTKFGNAYYIFRRGEEVTKKYEDSKPIIQASLRNRRSYTVAAELSQKVSDRLKEVKNVEQVAGEFAAQANMSTAEMVRETGFLKKDDDVPNIGVSPQFEEGIAGLAAINDVGDKIPIKEGFAIPMLVDKKDPHEATFDEVKADVTNAYKSEQARARLEQIAKDIAAGATTAAGLKAIAESKGLKVQEAKDYRVGSPLGQGMEAGTSEALEDAVFALKTGEVTKTPVKIGDNWYVVGLTERLDASMDEFAKQRDSLVQQSLGMKQGQVFSDFMAESRRRYETEGRIKIYDAAIQKLEAAPVGDEAA